MMRVVNWQKMRRSKRWVNETDWEKVDGETLGVDSREKEQSVINDQDDVGG